MKQPRAPRRVESQPQPDPQTPHRWGPRWVAILLSLLWIVGLLGQGVAEDTPRWVLFLIPDTAILSWFDGPVSWRGLADRLAVIGVAALVVAQAAISGALLLRGFRWFEAGERAERVALAAAFGLGIQANVTLAVGLAGGLRMPAAPLAIAALSWLCGAAAGWGIRRWTAATECKTAAREPAAGLAAAEQDAAANGAPSPGWPWIVVRALAGVLAALLVLRAVLPPAEYDVREYHLQAAKEWWQAGEIGFVPHNIYANMPMAAESQAIVAMTWFELWGAAEDAWWWGALSGKVVVAAYAILTAVLVGALARRLIQDRWMPLSAAWAGVLVLAFPAMVEVASLGLIEPAVAVYLAAGLCIATLAQAPGAGERHRERAGGLGGGSLAVGFAGGFAVACKYPAVLFVLPVLAAALGGLPGVGGAGGVRELRGAAAGSGQRIGLARPKDYLLFALAVAVGGGWWYAKNAVLAGNPVYPLLGQWFGGETLTAEKIAQWNRGHSVPGYSLGGLVNSVAGLLWGWRLQGWLLVPAVIWGIVLGWRHPSVRWLLGGACFVLAAWWLTTHRVERFLIPVSPLAFAVAAVGVAELHRAFGARWATVVLSGLVAMNFLYIAGPVLGDARIAVDLRYLRRDDESASSLSRLPEHVRWVNQNLTAEDRLLVVGEAAVFDFEVPLAYSTTFDRSPLAGILERPETEWKEALRDAGFTHLLVHWGEIARLRSSYGFDARITPAAIDRMQQAGAIEPIEVELSGGAVQVYAVPQA